MTQNLSKQVTILGIVDDTLFIAPIFGSDSIYTATIDEHNKSYFLAAGITEHDNIGCIVKMWESEMSNPQSFAL
jgi:hypothetical protein